MVLPDFLKKYFWDVAFEKLDPSKHSKDILGRILECGDEEATQWMGQHYSKADIEDFLLHHRNISRKSANYWAVLYGVPKDRILCLQKHYQQTQRQHWAY